MKENSQINKVLISMIEDNEIIRSSISKFLSKNPDFEIIKVFSSVESFLHHKKFEPEFSPNILLLDIGLPGQSGLEAIPYIKENFSDIDIIMLTTYEEEDKILEALCSGACSYLSKRSSLAEIAQAVDVVSHGGSYMSPSIARKIVHFFAHGKTRKLDFLPERQMEILELLVDGKTYQEIGQCLFISAHTVKCHIKKLYKNLQVNNKAEAIAKYLNN